MACRSCVRELHDECPNPKENDECCCKSENEESTESIFIGVEKPGKVRVAKSDVSISAGRKRAATLYPLHPEEDCEWKGFYNCGGGLYPIVGCTDGKQEARHHGPVKNTEVNHRGNIHRICHGCHNNWHAKNDPYYDRDDKAAEARFALLPHQPRDMITGLEVDNLE